MGYFNSPDKINPVYSLGFMAMPVILDDMNGLPLEQVHINVVIQHRFLIPHDRVVEDEDFHDFLTGSISDDEWIVNKSEVLKNAGIISDISDKYSYDFVVEFLKNFKEYVLDCIPESYEYLAGRLSVFIWLNNMVYSERMLRLVSEDGSALNDVRVASNVKVFQTLSKEFSGDKLFDAVDRYAELPVEYIQHMLDSYSEGLTFTEAVEGITR